MSSVAVADVAWVAGGIVGDTGWDMSYAVLQRYSCDDNEDKWAAFVSQLSVFITLIPRLEIMSFSNHRSMVVVAITYKLGNIGNKNNWNQLKNSERWSNTLLRNSAIFSQLYNLSSKIKMVCDYTTAP